MGLHMLNISVDTQDPNPEHIAEDLSFNDQESIVEIVVEQVLGFENAIKEYDDHDTEDHNRRTHVKIDLSVHFALTTGTGRHEVVKRKQSFPDHEARLTDGFYDLDSPPPKI